MTDTRIYAWGIQAFQGRKPLLANFEHTWITSYEQKADPVNHPDPPADWKPPESYWYCWGSAHDVAERAIESASGSLEVATAICPANTVALPPNSPLGTPSTTSGTIEYYGLDGVCHNVSNQVLYSTGSKNVEPLRVNRAKGYPLVSFFFKNYGLNESSWNSAVQNLAPDVKPPEDDFLLFMHQFVPSDKQTKLLAIRLQAHIELVLLRASAAKKNFNYDPELGAIIVGALLEAEVLLGTETLLKVFPVVDIRDTSWLRPLI